jgi:hypothetical protein
MISLGEGGRTFNRCFENRLEAWEDMRVIMGFIDDRIAKWDWGL